MAAAAVTVAAPFVEWAEEYPFLVHRVFALFALAATVLSIAWLIDRAKRPSIPVAAETTYKLGIDVGREMGRMEAALQRWNAPGGQARHPLAGEPAGRQDTPPYMWRR
ncbi:hypothetical protein ABZW11_16930 [Nonomuraea sp. NPDC004580]|uniref:hypothetical protein n=1 Tax=Nonomuraea sp. NPDC004580 TaxID=3154552 RepID=UPI0033A2663E